jgi:hypothetical protein
MENNKQEVWKDVPNYENLYMVSNMGRVLRKYNGYNKILVKILKPSGYHVCSLSKNNVRIQIRIHVLVASAFLEYKYHAKDSVVNHKDGNRINNTLSNLEIISQRDNVFHSNKNKLIKYAGVRLNKTKNRYISGISIKRNYIRFGTFDTQEQAHSYYKIALENESMFNNNYKEFKNYIKSIVNNQ